MEQTSKTNDQGVDLIGFIDDIFSIKPKPRLALQALETLLAFGFLENMNFPLFRDLIFGNYLQQILPVTPFNVSLHISFYNH